MTIALAYLMLCAVASWAAAFLHVKDRRDALRVAAMLTTSCGLYNATIVAGTWTAWPPLDALQAWIVAALCRERPAAWKRSVVALLIDQEVAHIAWAATGGPDRLGFLYGGLLNVLFVAQLACVAFSGDRRVRDYLHDALGGWVRVDRRRGFRVLLRGPSRRVHPESEAPQR